MSTVPVTLVSWSGGPTTTATATIAQATFGARVFSALKTIGLGLIVAVVLLPVPVIHLAGIGFFFACLGLATWQLRPGTRVHSIEGPCPHCGYAQRYWLGLNLGPMHLPKDTSCESCTKTLTIEGELRDVPA